MKILLIPIISIAVFKLPFFVVAGLVVVQIILGFCFHFTLRQQLLDLRPVLYYAVLLIFTKLIGAAFAKQLPGDFLPTLIMLLKLFCVMQTASLVFRTSTPLQLRESLEKIELGIRKVFHLKRRTPVAEALALFICFIPQVSKNWEMCKKAWFARGGKKSLKMLIVLLPVLFSVGMKQAYNSARARSARRLPGRIPA